MGKRLNTQNKIYKECIFLSNREDNPVRQEKCLSKHCTHKKTDTANRI